MPPRIGPKTPPRVFLAAWRDKYGLSQETLGSRFDPPVDKETVSKIENNTRPAITVLAAYAEALDPDLHWTVFARLPPEASPGGDLEAVASHLEETAQMLRKRAQ